ncbi:hypothetical protein LX36DRAFT_352483 [Colletotrichum falcatum]|nr:hypothetical protein LX36DRAFT_352483 [Colletotrichum falcatum]
MFPSRERALCGAARLSAARSKQHDPECALPQYGASSDHVDVVGLAGIFNDVIRWCPSRSPGTTTTAQRTALWRTVAICHPKSRLDAHDEGTKVQTGFMTSPPPTRACTVDAHRYLETPLEQSRIPSPQSREAAWRLSTSELWNPQVALVLDRQSSSWPGRI